MTLVPSCLEQHNYAMTRKRVLRTSDAQNRGRGREVVIKVVVSPAGVDNVDWRLWSLEAPEPQCSETVPRLSWKGPGSLAAVPSMRSKSVSGDRYGYSK